MSAYARSWRSGATLGPARRVDDTCLEPVPDPEDRTKTVGCKRPAGHPGGHRAVG